jgi:acyl-CoA synthetase (AMP-forming)/AMP-acid ligase II
VVVRKPGAVLEPEQIVATLKSKLANFKIPKKCYVVDDLPRNTMGKVQKNLLRDQYTTLFSCGLDPAQKKRRHCRRFFCGRTAFSGSAT